MLLRCPYVKRDERCEFRSGANVSGFKVVVTERVPTHTCGSARKTKQSKLQNGLRNRIVKLKAEIDAGKVGRELKLKRKAALSEAARPLKIEIKQLKSTGIVSLPTRRYKFPSEKALLVHLFAYSQQRDFILDRRDGPANSLHLFCKGQRSKPSSENHCSYEIKAKKAEDGVWSIDSSSHKHDHRILDVHIHNPFLVASSSSSEDDEISDESDGGQSDVEIVENQNIAEEQQDLVEKPDPTPQAQEPKNSTDGNADISLPPSPTPGQHDIELREHYPPFASTADQNSSSSPSPAVPSRPDQPRIKPELDVKPLVVPALPAVTSQARNDSGGTAQGEKAISASSSSETQEIENDPLYNIGTSSFVSQSHKVADVPDGKLAKSSNLKPSQEPFLQLQHHTDESQRARNRLSSPNPPLESSHDTSSSRVGLDSSQESQLDQASPMKAEDGEQLRDQVVIANAEGAIAPPQDKAAVSSLKRNFETFSRPILTRGPQPRPVSARKDDSKVPSPARTADFQLDDSSKTSKTSPASEPSPQPEVVASAIQSPSTSTIPSFTLPRPARKRNRWTAPREGTYSVGNLASFVRSFHPQDLNSTLLNLESIGISSLDTLIDVLSMEQDSIELFVEGVDEALGVLVMKMVKDLHENMDRA